MYIVRLDATRRHQAVVAFATRQLFIMVYLQKFAIGPLTFQVSVPMLLMVGDMTWMLVTQKLRCSPSKLGCYLLFISLCLLSQLVLTTPWSLPSFLQLVLIYAAMTLTSDISDADYRRIIHRFVSFMMVPSGIVIFQYSWQKLTGLPDFIDMDAMLPKTMLSQGFFYNAHYPFWFSHFTRPNGFFFLEPSTVSLYTGAATIFEMTYFKRLRVSLLMIVATGMSTGGTGITLLLLATPLVYLRALRTAPHIVVMVMTAVVVGLVTAILLGADLPLVSRLDELNHSGDSGAQRLTIPFTEFLTRVFDPGYFFSGTGAGSTSLALGSAWPILKIINEYGLLTMLAFVAFYVTVLRSNRYDLPLKIAISVIFHFTGGYLVDPFIVNFLAILCIKPPDRQGVRLPMHMYGHAAPAAAMPAAPVQAAARQASAQPAASPQVAARRTTSQQAATRQAGAPPAPVMSQPVMPQPVMPQPVMPQPVMSQPAISQPAAAPTATSRFRGHGLKTFLRFFSLTAATQLCLLVNQLGLLPLQLRVWGNDMTAHWFVIVAIANLTSIGDLGLRNAAHASLLAAVRGGDPAAALSFRQTWALTRALMLGLTVVLLGYQVFTERNILLLAFCVTISQTVDSALIIRAVWLDTLGLFNKVEGLFLTMIAVRIAISMVALVAFQASPQTLAYIMLATAIPGLVGQARFSPPMLGFLTGGFTAIRWRTFALIRLVVAEPVSSWVRISLPVVVFAAIAPASFVTLYVALRAVFGSARQIIIQVSRYASVLYVRRIGGDAVERIIIPAIFAATTIGVGVSSVTLADHGRLVQLWLGSVDRTSENVITLSYAVGVIAYTYLVNATILMRIGDVTAVAKRNYSYLVISALTGVVGYLAGSERLYLVLLAAQEVVIAGLFATVFGRRARQAFVIAFVVAAAALGGLIVVVEADLGGIFTATTLFAGGCSLAAAGLTTVATSGILLAALYRFTRAKTTVDEPNMPHLERQRS